MGRWAVLGRWGAVGLALGAAGCGDPGGELGGASKTMMSAPVASEDMSAEMVAGDAVAGMDSTPVTVPASSGAGAEAAAEDILSMAGDESPLSYATCEDGMRVGAFTVSLVAGMEGAGPFTQVTGRVRDAGDPREVWDEVMRDGDCRLIVGPSNLCDPRCAAGENCVGDNLCMAPPQTIDVGVVTLDGLGIEAEITANPGNGQYYYTPPASAMLSYPPFAEGDALALQAAGGDYAPFKLRSQGIAPLVVDQAQFTIAEDTPLQLAWQPPGAAGLVSRVQVLVDIAHHGGISARIECDLADTGSAAIPAGLVTALMDRGVAGFPIVALARRVVDTADFELGCVEFSVLSSVERPATIPGFNSCNTDEDCPEGQFCTQGRLCSE